MLAAPLSIRKRRHVGKRQNARSAACLIPKRHDDDGPRHNVCSYRDRRGCGLAWAWPLVLGAFREEHFSGRCGLFVDRKSRRTSAKGLCRLGLALAPYLRHVVDGRLPGIIKAIFNERARLIMKILDIESSGLIFPIENHEFCDGRYICSTNVRPRDSTSPKLYRRMIHVLLKNQASVTSPGLVSGLRFRVPILDLNQINSPRAQPLCRSVRHFCEVSRSGGWQL